MLPFNSFKMLILFKWLAAPKVPRSAYSKIKVAEGAAADDGELKAFTLASYCTLEMCSRTTPS